VNREEIVDRFLDNAAKAAAGVRLVEDRQELPRILSELLPEGIAVYCPARSELEEEALCAFSGRVDDYASAEATVEEVLAGIAETGSIVCASVEGRAVQASVLPSRHVALLPAEKIFSTLDEFFTSMGASPPTNFTLITGPSRTADIELTLAIGVHGPERLDVIVL